MNGGTQYFIFLFLPFGLSSAVHCITKILKPVNAYLHEKGIRHSIYLDDGRITAASQCQAEEHRVFVYDVLQKSGFIIETKKSDQKGDANKSKEYLGFIIDTGSMTVRLGETKKQLILRQVEETIDYGPKPILARDLASTLGKMVAMEPALGPVVIMAARAAYIDLDKAVQQRGWGTRLVMSEESIKGMKFIVENCYKFDNSPIRSATTELSVLSIIGPPSSFMKQSFVANHARTKEEKIWASDASGFATCAYSIKGEHLYFRGMLREFERKLSSGHRELIAVTRTLEYYERNGVSTGKATTIYWLTDSQNMATFLTKGSGKRHIQSEVFRIMVLCQRLNIRIIPIHLLRDDPRIQIADDGSKTTDTDDWQVDVETYQTINNKYKFTIDLFASDRNKKCQRFFSNFYCHDTSGIDAFSHSWEDEVAWICPPIREVIQIIKRLKTSKTNGVLFVPEWRTADYWVEIFDREGFVTLSAAIAHEYRTRMLQSPTTHETISLLFRGFRNEHPQTRVTKSPITKEILSKMYSHLFRPEHGRDGLRASVVLWRTVWRISLEYYTLGRFSDIAKLQKKDVVYKPTPSPHLKILFKGGKNDQYSEGSERIVASNPDDKICPVKLTINYFQFLGPIYSGYLVPSCTPKNTPNPNKAVSYSGALCDMKKLMSTLGYDAKLYGEHSGKRGGATTAAANGATDKQLKRLGGWRSDTMAAKYVDLSINSRISMSQLLQK
ncbi:Uncharacterized protein APZ42_027551 [Daphnia magna]|uniref:Reverse transcriptase domain-containing protein n=1 Tax=Daphnia magna TaxID=35525 RepID=A0A164R979_9CRUS|nr:Uncharacterized protein APZ42_027551 [Daphnia magna]